MESGRRFGGLLLGTGAGVAVVAVVGLVVGFEPARLPAALLNIAAYKLTFAAAAALLATGAILRRRANRESERRADHTTVGGPGASGSVALPPRVGDVGFDADRSKQRETEHVRRSQNER